MLDKPRTPEFIETNILLALLGGDTAEAERLIDSLNDRELSHLCTVAEVLFSLCDGRIVKRLDAAYIEHDRYRKGW